MTGVGSREKSGKHEHVEEAMKLDEIILENKYR